MQVLLEKIKPEMMKDFMRGSSGVPIAEFLRLST